MNSNEKWEQRTGTHSTAATYREDLTQQTPDELREQHRLLKEAYFQAEHIMEAADKQMNRIQQEMRKRGELLFPHIAMD